MAAALKESEKQFKAEQQRQASQLQDKKQAQLAKMNSEIEQARA
jgi:hypothetical protein